MKRAVIYCRVSTEMQEERGYSLGEQDYLCLQYLLNKGYKLAGRVQEVISGTTHSRPEMDRVLTLARKKEIDVVVCLELDRFARGPAPMILLERELKKNGVTIEYVKNQFEDSPMGDFMKTITAGMAELERLKILERSMRGKDGKARAGKVVQSPNPAYGYRAENNTYVIDEPEAAIVRQVYKWYTEGALGYVAIAHRLTVEGHPCRSDSARYGSRRTKQAGTWNMSTIRNILSNTVYSGRLAWGKNRSEPIYVSVPPIISQDLFDKAQEQKTRNTRFNPGNTKREYLLSGILYCATCGQRFYALSKEPGDAPRYYRCGSQVPDHKPYIGYVSDCSRTYIKAGLIEEVVWAAVVDVLKDPMRITESIRQQYADQRTAVEDFAGQIDTLEKEIEKITHQEKRLLDLYLEDRLTQSILSEKSKELAATRISLETSLKDLRDSHVRKIVSPEQIHEIEATVKQMSRGVEKFSYVKKRQTLQMLKTVARLNKETGEITISGLVKSVSSYTGYMQYCLIADIH